MRGKGEGELSKNKYSADFLEKQMKKKWDNIFTRWANLPILTPTWKKIPCS